MQQQYLGVGETFNFQEIEVKGEKEYAITGYISTKSVDKFNDLITDECLDDMVTQIKSGSIKLDFEHETIHEGNLNINPVARIVDVRKDDKGVWVKAILNKSHSKFKELWGSIKGGFLDAFSIAFKPLETATRYIQGKAVRILNKLKLINVGITGTPVNEECRMDKVVVKAIRDMEIKEDIGLKSNDEENKDNDEPECKEEDYTEEEIENLDTDMKSAIKFLEEKGCKVKKRVKIEKKALNTQSGLLGKPENNESHSTSEEDDNMKMAEEGENKPVEQTEVNESEKTEEVEQTVETQEVQETTDSNNEQNESTEVKSLQKELAEVKSQLAEVQKLLAKPELKAVQEAEPITKLKETVTPLGLIG